MNIKNWVLDPAKYLSKEEAEKLLAVARDRAENALSRGLHVPVRDFFIIHLAMATGLRVMEIAALECGDIHLASPISSLMVRCGKGSKKRIVFFNGRLRLHCEEYFDWKNSIGEPTDNKSPLLLSSNTGGHMTTRAIQKTFKRCAKLADLPVFYSIHSLRHSEVLHRGLCIILAMSNLPQRDLITRPRVEENLAHAFSMTLGDVINALAGKLPKELSVRLNEAGTKRNFLAHHFWFDRAHLMFQANQIETLIVELDSYAKIFCQLDEDVSAWFQTRRTELGLTNDIIQQSLVCILQGQDEHPLPGKDTLRQISKKLKNKQRLLRVWEVELTEGGKPLVFEMEDGTLWQLCDIGLGWTRFQQIESHWIEHSAIQPYLPAEIIPRPKDAKPWEYEFKLDHGAILWVKPGRQPRTFQWGIRTQNTTQ